MIQKSLLACAFVASMASAVCADDAADNTTRSVSLQPSMTMPTKETPQKSLLQKLDAGIGTIESKVAGFCDNKLGLSKQKLAAYAAQLGSNAAIKTTEMAERGYHLVRHPLNTIKRLLYSVKRQLKRRPNRESRLAMVGVGCLWLATVMILHFFAHETDAAGKPILDENGQAKIKSATADALCLATFLAPFIQAFYDNNLSSAQLRTKNWFRRFAGWALRHRVLTPFGYDRGSIQNTEKLLQEYAELPANADEKLRLSTVKSCRTCLIAGQPAVRMRIQSCKHAW